MSDENKLLLRAEEILRRELSELMRLNRVSYKSINEVLREYQDDLESLVVDAVNGNLKSGDMSRTHKRLLKTFGLRAYIEGLREGGIKNAEQDIEEEDEIFVSNWASDQGQYTLEFARAAEEASQLSGDQRTAARNRLLDRVEDWVESLKYIGQRGYLSAKGNMFLTFDGDDGLESCQECQQYKGQRHRMNWWRERGLLERPNHRYSCGRFAHCNHHFFNDDGEIVID